MVTYEVWGRPPRKGARSRLVKLAVFSESRWQLALKIKAVLSERGFKNCVVRELEVTHESG